MKEYRIDLDFLKGVAIIAVVLFHTGLLKSGYLGVDVFFVINGYLLLPSLLKNIANGNFSYKEFLLKRLIRLLPLIVLVSFVSMFFGYWLMLPDDYENLSQSVAANNLMSENILELITTKNYWDQGNDYKPLMHLWYVGILVEFYIITPILLLGFKKIANYLRKDIYKCLSICLLITSLLSFILYLLPIFTTAEKFYSIPFRYYEIAFGGIIGIYSSKFNKGFLYSSRVNGTTLFLLVGLVFSSGLYSLFFNTDTIINVIGLPPSPSTGIPLDPQLALLLTVLLSCIVINRKCDQLYYPQVVSFLGKMSYSLFIWHQPILALYRYSISSNFSDCFIIIFFIVTLFISVFSYYTIEKRIKNVRSAYITTGLMSVVMISVSLYFYSCAGVVRNVPELGIEKTNVHRGMFAEYCDRVYEYKSFPEKENAKLNVLVVGVSYGRDFANILLESEYKDKINLVYAYKWTDKNIVEKVKKSDFIFTFSPATIVEKDIYEKMDDISPTIGVPYFVNKIKKEKCIIYGIGTKNYGASNGVVYFRRNKTNYYKTTQEVAPGYIELNNTWKKEWGDYYIDLLTPVLISSNRVRVFTDDNKYISQDCSHLTQFGAKWYAKKLNLNRIFKNANVIAN